MSQNGHSDVRVRRTGRTGRVIRGDGGTAADGLAGTSVFTAGIPSFSGELAGRAQAAPHVPPDRRPRAGIGAAGGGPVEHEPSLQWVGRCPGRSTAPTATLTRGAGQLAEMRGQNAAAIAEMTSGLRDGDPEAAVEYFSAALDTWTGWPEGLPVTWRAAYDSGARQLVPNWELSRYDVVPEAEAGALHDQRGSGEGLAPGRPASQRRTPCRDVLAQIAKLCGRLPAFRRQTTIHARPAPAPVPVQPRARQHPAALQQRMGLAGAPAKAARTANRVPAHLMLFDLVYLDGRLRTGLPYAERRGPLEGLRAGRAVLVDSRSRFAVSPTS